ncbi:uncharacterized protein LOC133495358 [Syngnathoides biaculeatus]|uniref:uncharacterized protein LOC133495358 n=1 Tax=Syngnathoides biaculeatus TaxID=300417 RepID=UPI002ADD3F94|nr:uncharacterized protein LOC133495358 [Syngnathoides biaculeatus]
MLNTPKKMNKGSTANNDAECPTKSSCRYNNVIETNGKRAPECKGKQGLVISDKQEVGRQSGRTTSTSSSHQRRWSSDCCYSNSSTVIIIKKNVSEPQPPQRGSSLLRSHPPSRCPRQRYSSPIIGTDHTSHVSTSSSSSWSSSPVRTALITGHDPLGWKLRPKSGTYSNRAHIKRLSLPLPVTIPDPNFLLSNKSPTTSLDPVRKTKTHYQNKPTRRHHSDSSAFLGSMPMVTLEELRGVHLRSNKPDDIFCEEKTSPRQHKKPPAVPEKSPLARKIAQLIAHSGQQQLRAARKIEQGEIIYSVIKPKSKRRQAENHCSLDAKMNGMHLKSHE